MKLFNFKWTWLLLLLSGNLLAAPLSVVTSFSILGDVAQQIGGNRISVRNIVGAGQDIHVYQLKNADIRQLNQAKLILFNGYGLEPLPMQRAAKQSKVPLAYVAQGIRPREFVDTDGDHHGHNHNYDPHVWNDPIAMKIYVRNIAQALIKVDPQGKNYYQKRLQAYQQSLNSLDRWAQQMFARIPVNKRKVITGHDAFGYFAHRYRITFLAPQGISTHSEPSAKQVANIIRQIKKQHIRAVFTENIKDPKLVNRIAKETGVRVSGKLYSDALSTGEPANTYIKLFKHNVTQLSSSMK